ncbi:MAG: hypothetical protein HYR88_02590 [Verrucomicrobia bacterium]|nr:hypothetical protein [Verrucomicrobiota bacterium]MBI3867608.1 hypothetical protein [Verrucomicrobiota bacterium]
MSSNSSDPTRRRSPSHTLALIGLALLATAWPQSLSTAAPAPLDYRFDGRISREVLENYLEHSISFTELLHDDLTQRRARGPDPQDNIRMLLNIQAKFVGRALMCWAREAELETLLSNAKPDFLALNWRTHGRN